MEIQIQKDIREISQIRRWLPNDMLEAYLELSSMYSREYWLLLHTEFLRRMDLEISIL